MPKSGSPNNPDQQPDRGKGNDSRPQKTAPRKVPPPFKPGKK